MKYYLLSLVYEMVTLSDWKITYAFILPDGETKNLDVPDVLLSGNRGGTMNGQKETLILLNHICSVENLQLVSVNVNPHGDMYLFYLQYIT